MSGDDISGLARRWGQRTRTHRREEDSEEQLEAMTPAMIYPLGAHLRVVTLSHYLQIVTTLRAAVTVTVGTLHITQPLLAVFNRLNVSVNVVPYFSASLY